MTDVAEVYVAFGAQNVLVGRLFAHRRRGAESASFAYADSWLTDRRAFSLDPGLPLLSGTQQTASGRAMFPAFSDSSPDRWGRTLILRAERRRAAAVGGQPRSLGAFELLLGVRDDLRQGAVRFREPDQEAFAAPEATGVPVLTDLPALLDSADRVGSDSEDDDDLRLLLEAGSSLGGARPKAHLRDQSGRLAIAKFPSPADSWDVMAWEKAALDLSRMAGVVVPDSRLASIGGRQVLIVDRFDRTATGSRIGYVSAMTMVEAREGGTGSYVDIAAAIEARSRETTPELEQLWRRIAVTVLVSNTDDHLRNHGFLHVAGDSWSLSPAFDINPNPAGSPRHLSTAIDETDTRARIATLMTVAPLFRLPPAAARRVLFEVLAGVSQWRMIASAHGLSRRAQSEMAPAFEHTETRAAREIVGLP